MFRCFFRYDFVYLVEKRHNLIESPMPAFRWLGSTRFLLHGGGGRLYFVGLVSMTELSGCIVYRVGIINRGIGGGSHRGNVV